MSAGRDTVYAPVPAGAEVSGTRRWSLSVEWVAAAARIRTKTPDAYLPGWGRWGDGRSG